MRGPDLGTGLGGFNSKRTRRFALLTKRNKQTLGLVTTIFNGVESFYHDKRQATLQVDYLTQPWLIMSTAAAKISITIMLLRVAADLKAWRIMFMIQAAVIFIFSTMACFVVALQCRPMQKLWRPEVEGVCLSPHVQHELEHVQGGE